MIGKGQEERRKVRRKKEKRLNQWSEERMRAAIDEYRETMEAGRVPKLRFLARAYNVPKSTLQRRIKGKGDHTHAIGRKPFINERDEAELAELIKTLARRGFPIRMEDVQSLAFQFAKKGIKGFSEEKQKAGWTWFQGFMKRSNKLSMRKPEALSSSRASLFNRPVVMAWFDNYMQIVKSLDLEDSPSHIWNCDETGLQDYFLSSMVVGETGEPCYEITSGEKGETTCLASMNAAGEYGTKMIIFKGKRMKPQWLEGCPPFTMVRMSDNGWINSQLFVVVGLHNICF